jgi:hypothetical protein
LKISEVKAVVSLGHKQNPIHSLDTAVQFWWNSVSYNISAHNAVDHLWVPCKSAQGRPYFYMGIQKLHLLVYRETVIFWMYRTPQWSLRTAYCVICNPVFLVWTHCMASDNQLASHCMHFPLYSFSLSRPVSSLLCTDTRTVQLNTVQLSDSLWLLLRRVGEWTIC